MTSALFPKAKIASHRPLLHFLLPMVGLAFFLTGFTAQAQTPIWGHSVGGAAGDDRSWASHKGPNGTIILSGTFKGTMDIDPSASTYNLTSNGQEDIFVATFSSTGGFISAFSIGGPGLDVAVGIHVDSFGNVYLTGWFRGPNVDFDPSPTGVANLSETGNSVGVTWPWGGDIFVAKYSSAGAYQWAFKMGDVSQYDVGICIGVDPAGYVYVAGQFHGTIDIDPSPTVTNNLFSGNGTGFLIKLTSGGQLVRGVNYGLGGGGGVDNEARAMRIDNNGNIYLSGFFQGNNIDFNFSPTASALLPGNGWYDVFVAKYDSAFNYQFALSFGTAGLDATLGIDIDALGDVYVTGIISGNSVDFDPSPATAIATAPGSDNFFVAKYSATGQYLWGKLLGGSSYDRGNALHVNGSHVFVTGSFQGTVDFDPSAAVANLVSAGLSDAFAVKYDLNGNYVCGFRSGSTGNDVGATVLSYVNDEVILTGEFAGTNVDFDPGGANTFNLSSNGFLDMYFLRYNWTSATTLPNGYLAGDTVCAGQQAYLTYVSTTGPGFYNITYSNGTSVSTQLVQSGIPFALTPNPLATQTYTLQQVQTTDFCGASTATVNSTATVLVDTLPVANAGPDIFNCNNAPQQLNGTGTGTFSWAPAGALNNPNTATPSTVYTDTALSFILTVTSTFGCIGKDTVNVSIRPNPNVKAGPDTGVCLNNVVQLQGSGNGNIYQWVPSLGLNNPSISNPVFSGSVTSTYSLIITNQYGCSDTDDVTITVHPLPVANAGSDTTICSNNPYTLSGSGGGSYLWYPATNLLNANTATPTVTATGPVTYYLQVTSQNGCHDTDMINLNVLPLPTFSVSPPEARICEGDTAHLQASGGDFYSWYPSFTVSDPSAPNPYVTPLVNTVYHVVISKTLCNYVDTLTVTLELEEKPTIALLKSNDIDCSHTSSKLSVFGADTYEWLPADLVSGSGNNVYVAPKENSSYTVIGTSEYGCKDSASIEVKADLLSVPVAFPDAFTPNGDGLNDCFKVIYKHAIEAYKLSIYNRWGEMVFTTSDPAECWDGSHNRTRQDVNTFYYYYTAKTEICGEYSGKGSVIVLR